MEYYHNFINATGIKYQDAKYFFDNGSCVSSSKDGLYSLDENQQFFLYSKCQELKQFYEMMERYADYFVFINDTLIPNPEWQKRANQNRVDLHNLSHPRHCLLMDSVNDSVLKDD